MNSHLATLINHLPPGSLTRIDGADMQLRNGDVHYPFRQDSDFLYLTGLSVPGLVVTIYLSGSKIQEPGLLHASQGQEQEVILWRELITEKDRIWGSDKLTDTELSEISGMTDIRDIVGLEEYCLRHREEGSDPGQIKGSPHNDWIASPAHNDETKNPEDWKPIVHQMRMIKTPDEIRKIRKAIRITNMIYEDILTKIQPGMYEYEIEALVAYGFRRYHGTEAFPTIVASGPNACILHYTKNTRSVEEGDMVLLDFGIEIDGYGADISRTFPVGGTFSPRQRELYDAVLGVQQFAASILRPGMTRRDWNIQVKKYIYDTCKSLGLKDIAEYTPETNPYFPHSIGHFLGLDTHDVGDADMPLEPGMILTIEPGIYICDEGIGIRIEDDYLVTETGCERLG